MFNGLLPIIISLIIRNVIVIIGVYNLCACAYEPDPLCLHLACNETQVPMLRGITPTLNQSFLVVTTELQVYNLSESAFSAQAHTLKVDKDSLPVEKVWYLLYINEYGHGFLCSMF